MSRKGVPSTTPSPRVFLLLVGILLTGCGKDADPRKDRYVTTGSTDWLEFVAGLEREAPILEHVAIKDIPLRLAGDVLVRDGVLKVAREAGFDDVSEVVWVRTSPGSGADARTRLALKVIDRRKGRDAEWWGTVSRTNDGVVVDQVMGGGHESR